MAALLFLIVVLIFSLFSSCSSMGTGGIGAIAASSYTAEDQDINNAELVYTEWETDLQMQIDNAEADHPGYDEYRYHVGNIGHNPFELMGFLTASYQAFQYADVEAVLQEIFAEQYSLEFVEEVETRTRTETRTDPSTGETYEVEVTYEWRILNVNLTAKSFTDVIGRPHERGTGPAFQCPDDDEGQPPVCLQRVWRYQLASVCHKLLWLPRPPHQRRKELS